MHDERDYWMKWMPGDWRADVGLSFCSAAARGVWAELLWLMFLSERRGYLLIGGEPPADEASLALAVRVKLPELRSGLAELKKHRIYSETPEGVIFCRRMVRDARRRATNKANGDKGGNPTLTTKSVNPNAPESVNPPSTELDNQDLDWLTESVNTKKQEARGKRQDLFDDEDPQESDKGVSSTPATDADAEPPVMTFPTTGAGRSGWPLSLQQLADWQALYPALDVRAEMLKAYTWLLAASTRRKTHGGMARFLVNWLNRATDRPHPTSTPQARPRGAGPAYTGNDDWADECARLHGGACSSRYTHSLQPDSSQEKTPA